MQNTDPREFDALPGRSHTHKSLLHRPRNCVAGHECVAFTNEILNDHLCIGEYLPEGIIKLLHTFQPRFDSLVSVQEDVV